MALWRGCIPFGQIFVAFWLKMSYTKVAIVKQRGSLHNGRYTFGLNCV